MKILPWKVFHFLKVKFIHDEYYVTRAQASQSIIDYIECYYNFKRQHSTIGNQVPMVYDNVTTPLLTLCTFIRGKFRSSLVHYSLLCFAFSSAIAMPSWISAAQHSPIG